MPSNANYTIEYLIDIQQFSKEQLTEHIKEKLVDALPNVTFEIQKKPKHLLLRIVSNEKIIDSCHEKLEFEGKWSFRAKDELGDFLRSNAYPILAEIELRLRSFIKQAMTEVLGFDWWSFTSGSIQEKTKDIASKSKNNQVETHHPIEFTFFDNLLGIVTEEFQDWSDSRAITVNDLSELLSTCNSIAEIQEKVENRKRKISFWDDVFSKYFTDKESWTKLESRIKKSIIPIRNKVMHHRLMRLRELKILEECRDEINRVLSSAKPKLSEEEHEKIQPSVKIITDRWKYQHDLNIFQGAMLASASEHFKSAAMSASPSKHLTMSATPVLAAEVMLASASEHFKAISKQLNAISATSEHVKAVLATSEHFKAIRDYRI